MRTDFWDFGYEDSAMITWGQMLAIVLVVGVVGLLAWAVYKRKR